MSNKLNQKKLFWKEVQIDSGPKHPKRRNTIECSKRLYSALFSDLLSLDPIASGSDKARCIKICSLVSQSSFDGLVQLSEIFRKIVTEQEFNTLWLPSRFDRAPCGAVQHIYSDFKRRYSRLLEPSCFELFCQAKPILVRYVEQPDADRAWPINMLACFLTRTNIVRDELKWELATDFRLRDENLKHYSESNTSETPLVRAMREIVREWFIGFNLKGLIPHHGPGASAELSAKDAYLGNKYATLGIDARLRAWLDKAVPEWRDYYPIPELLIPPFERVSKLVFVPKSVKTMRAINKIPVSIMYWQQAVKDKLYEFMRSNKELHAVIQLEDASINAQYCLKGSRYGTFGTIDLSAASDSVSYQLVKDIFADVQVLIDAFDALRCDRCMIEEAEGEPHAIESNKFAPMGEALCFPIECIVFAACIEATLRIKGVDRVDTHKMYNVYGDDMVVRSEFCEDVIENLELLGFSVNMDKSFVHPESVFRESCGVEAYLGKDITPIRIPRSLVHPKDVGFKDMKQLKVLTDRRLKLNRRDVGAAYRTALFLEQLRPIYNGAFTFGLENLKLAILSMVDPYTVWWAEDSSEGWLTIDATNYRRSQNVGVSRDYQRYYVDWLSFQRVDWQGNSHAVESRYGYRYRIHDDEYRRFHWYLNAARRKVSDSVDEEEYDLLGFATDEPSLDTSRITTRPPAITVQMIARPVL